VVYILEAHASDAWSIVNNTKIKLMIPTPRSLEERGLVASSCVRSLSIEMPAVIDNIDNTTEAAYTGWPDRLYLVDRDGRIAFKSQTGPWGFVPADLDAQLKKITASLGGAVSQLQ
jgi:Iodothyronine deiodinase